MIESPATPQPSAEGRFVRGVNRVANWVLEHWLAVALGLLALWNILPWLAPLFMQWGWTLPAKGTHAMYVLFCHQLPQRSWFLFGSQFTYTSEEILLAMNGTTDAVMPLTMRAFIGTPEMGWKLAWSDRMISFYGGWLLAGLAYAALRPRWRGISLKLALILMLPLAVDGFTHMISDLGGLREGFRETNVWLATLTNSAFAADFYAGDQWGSFNSIMRLITGLLGAIGLIGWVFPYIDQAMRPAAAKKNDS